MRYVLLVTTLFLAAIAAPTQRPLVSFCDLVQNPAKYNGQSVAVRATGRIGFEWHELYCLDCLERGKAWLDIDSTLLDDADEKALKRLPDPGVANMTVYGVFSSGGHYGHLNGYPHNFLVLEIRDVVVVFKGLNPDKQKAAEERWACGGTDPR